MSTDETAPRTHHTILAEQQATLASLREQQDSPDGFAWPNCPVCGQPGEAFAKAHGAGTRIEHPGRAFPCSTSDVLVPTRSGA